MKICNAEAMKKIKCLEEELKRFDYNEQMNSEVSYKEGEEKSLPNYDYQTTRKEIEKINADIRKIKHALLIVNGTYLIDDFNISIGEALVYLAQLNSEYLRLQQLANRNKKTRRITSNGVLEYTECLYDPEQVKEDLKDLYAKIGKLQVAIDRANLNCFIDF